MTGPAAMDAVICRATAQLTALQRIHFELADLAESCAVDDGRVIVQLDAGGGLAGLTLRPGAGHGDPARLARLIVDACAEADRELTARRAALTAEFLEEFEEIGQGSDDPRRSAHSIHEDVPNTGEER